MVSKKRPSRSGPRKLLAARVTRCVPVRSLDDVLQGPIRALGYLGADQSDAVIANYSTGVLAKLGVGYETMKGVNAGLIYCAITGYGQDGPLKNRAGHDMNYQIGRAHV